MKELIVTIASIYNISEELTLLISKESFGGFTNMPAKLYPITVMVL